MMVQYYIGGENKTTIQKLLAGETVIVKGKGNSMTPKLKSGEAVIVEPITPDTMIKKRYRPLQGQRSYLSSFGHWRIR